MNYVQFAQAARDEILEIFHQDTPEVKDHFLLAAYRTGLSVGTTAALFKWLIKGEVELLIKGED